MGVIKKLVFRINKTNNIISHIIATTYSISSSYSVGQYSDLTPIIRYDISGNITPISHISTNPIVDLSLNTGIVYIDIYDTTQITSIVSNDKKILSLEISTSVNLTNLVCYSNRLSYIYVNSNIKLSSILCSSNLISTLDLSENSLLTTLHCNGNLIRTLDLSYNPLLTTVLCHYNPMTASANDQVFIDLDAHGLSNGSLYITNLRTSASDTAAANLISKGWDINYYSETFSIKTTSTSATWDWGSTMNVLPDNTLTWDFSIGFVGSYNVNEPNIDLSTNTGTSFITITNSEQITSLDASNKDLADIDIFQFPNLKTLFIQGNNLSSYITDNIIASLDINELFNGTLHIRNNRSRGVDSAFNNLILRGWTINETYIT